ncbi:MAG: GNAT family N-acetyltransferase [Promethearchaeota archaeon]
MEQRIIRLKETKEEIIIRHLKKSDVDGIWNNFNEVVEEGIYLPVFIPVLTEQEKRSWYDHVKKGHEICVVAEYPALKNPHNIIGQCEISNSEWDAASHVGILGIIVRKELRNRGVGRALIDFAVREAKRINNKKKIILSCFSNNKRALHLYKKLGFKKVGVRKKQFYLNSAYHDEVLMELWIEDHVK